MKKRIYFSVFIIAIGLLVSSYRRDNSPVVTKSFDLEDFKGITLSISCNVRIIEGQTQKVEITGREETVNNIKKTVSKGVWNIDLPNNYNKNYGKLNIVITSNKIEKLVVLGSGKITGEHALPLSAITVSGSGDIEVVTKSPLLKSTISGSGNLNISGKADKFKHHISGSGNLNGLGLETTNAEINISGSGRAKIFVKSKLNVTVNGSGSLYYKGKPSIMTNINGSGKIINLK